jgi:hypothetical protein
MRDGQRRSWPTRPDGFQLNLSVRPDIPQVDLIAASHPQADQTIGVLSAGTLRCPAKVVSGVASVRIHLATFGASTATRRQPDAITH